MKTQIKNLLKSKNSLFNESLSKELEKIEKKLKELENQLKTKSFKELQKDIPIVAKIKEEIKGVGEYTLLVILPLIVISKNKTVKQIQAYFGLNPIQYQSGSSVYKRPKISKKGNGTARKVLYMATMTAIKVNDIIKIKYDRLVESGKKKRVALTACMAHLLRAIYSNYHKLAIRQVVGG